jgi:hypothetical protein
VGFDGWGLRVRLRFSCYRLRGGGGRGGSRERGRRGLDRRSSAPWSSSGGQFSRPRRVLR